MLSTLYAKQIYRNENGARGRSQYIVHNYSQYENDIINNNIISLFACVSHWCPIANALIKIDATRLVCDASSQSLSNLFTLRTEWMSKNTYCIPNRIKKIDLPTYSFTHTDDWESFFWVLIAIGCECVCVFDISSPSISEHQYDAQASTHYILCRGRCSLHFIYFLSPSSALFFFGLRSECDRTICTNTSRQSFRKLNRNEEIDSKW